MVKAIPLPQNPHKDPPTQHSLFQSFWELNWFMFKTYAALWFCKYAGKRITYQMQDVCNLMAHVWRTCPSMQVPLLHFHERYQDSTKNPASSARRTRARARLRRAGEDTARLTWSFRYHDHFHGPDVLSSLGLPGETKRNKRSGPKTST